MFSTGTKRGLAATAVSALALAGLPLLAGPTSAVTHDSTLAAGDVDLLQPATDVSAKPDGQNATVRLTAIGGTAVTSVLFEYKIGDGPWTAIGTTARNDDGAFALEWNPTAIAGSGNVTIRATGTAPATPDTDSSAPLAVNNNLDTVNITDGPRLDVFQAPYTNNAKAGQFAVVSGTGSSPTATPTLDFYDPSADAFANRGGTTTSTTAQGGLTGTWRGVLDITGYDYGGTRDEILVKATGATDDAESFVLNRQALGTVTATADRGTVAGTGTTPVTVTVTDADGRPVAGAEVRREGGAYVGQTDADGKVTTAADNGQAAGATQYYYANATDSDPYEEGLGDKRSDPVAVGQYTPAATSLEADSANGPQFDYDEYDQDDITIQVKDQEGQDFATTQQVTYSWTFTAFDGAPSNVTTTGSTAAVNGQAVVPLPEQTEGGTYRLSAGLAANPVLGGGAIASKQLLTVKAGQAALVLSPDTLTADAGGETPVAGTLRLEDGTGLPGRPVTLTYAGGNAAFDQPSGADAATRTVTTGADGSFSATLDDPAPTGNATERGTVTAVTADYDDPNTPLDTDNAGAEDTAAVTFASDSAPTGSKVAISGLTGTGKPGAPSYGTVTVTDADGKPVPDTRVKLSVDGSSFFTDGPANGTAGAEAGDLSDLKQAITVVTGSDGKASFAVGLERSTELDDDGLAEDTVTATVGNGSAAVSSTSPVKWSSADPLNGGEVLITRAADRFQESGVLPKAPTTDDVAYDVKVTDQFGNPVKGETVALSASGGAAVVDAQGGPVTSTTSDLDEDPELFLSSERAGDATPTGTWQANRSVYAPDSPADADDDADIVTTDNGERVTGDGPATSFYTVDFTKSTFTLAQEGAETRSVGETVVEVYTAKDQLGEPIEFEVAFFRTGPGDASYDGTTDRKPTGEDGQASYVFSGSAEGEARVSAIGYDAGQPVSQSEAKDTVTFKDTGNPQPGGPITILLAGEDNGPANDVIRASVDKGEGETLQLFIIRGTDGNRRLVKIREKTVPTGGEIVFKKADRNGNRKTRYVAKIVSGGTTYKSNTQKIR